MSKTIRYTQLFLMAVAVLMAVAACQESFEDRCRRTAREYTERQCPRPDPENPSVVEDSMVFVDSPSKGFVHYYSVSDAFDHDSCYTESKLLDFREQVIANIRRDVTLRECKARDFTFTYRLRSATTGREYMSVTIGPDDYK